MKNREDLIDLYLRNELSAADRLEVEKLLDEDEAFKKDFLFKKTFFMLCSKQIKPNL